MIQITEKAKHQIQNLWNQEENKEQILGLRVSIVKGGCAGLSYKLDFEKKEVSPEDKVFNFDNISLIVSPESLSYIMGTTLDFDGGLNKKGFVFENPNATKTCGCGNSFKV